MKLHNYAYRFRFGRWKTHRRSNELITGSWRRGAQVFEYRGGSGLEYGFDSGGLQGVEDTILGRFSV